MIKIKIIKTILHLCFFVAMFTHQVQAADGKLIGTAGLIQVEGSGGGGIVPWATLSGYDSDEQFSISATATQLSLSDYRLNVLGVSASFYDKFEVSVAKQRFELSSLGGQISQNIIGLKYKLFGDAVYSSLPQVSIGLQHKNLRDTTIAKALGANDTKGTDFYLAATKIHLGAIAGYNAVWNVALRATKANEMGLLGFASESESDYKVMFEASAGLLLSRHFALGLEYRQKPDNLGLDEHDWMDFFVTYIPSKSVSFTLAWADLGTIAGAPNQTGLYFSMSGQFN